VKFRDGYSPAAQARALSVLRRRNDLQSNWIGTALLVRATDEPDAETAAQVLRRQPEVEWAHPNYLRRLTARPTDPNYSLQWNLEMIGMPAAWDINDGGAATVRIAVVDGGVTTVNTTLTLPLWTGTRFEPVPMPVAISTDLGASRILPGRDFVLGGPVVDFGGHGTAVASTALEETNNNVGVAGIAYRSSLMPMKACLSYWDIQILQGLLNIPGFVDPDEGGVCPADLTIPAIRAAADAGAQVINLSFTGPDAAPAEADAIRYAVQRGAFVTMAAGNSAQSGNLTQYPAAFARDIEGAVAVGAVGRSRRRAPYSNTGSYVELAAPGGDFLDGGSSGVIVQVGHLFSDFNPATVIRPRFDRYTLVGLEGTSFSAPHVAGAAALLSAHGITSPAAIEAILKQTATDLGATGRDNDFGFGLINPRAALRGMGLVR
jgi:serine protease